MKNREIIEASHNENREWILLLATICVISIKMPSYFIYQKKSRNLKDI